MSGQPNEFSERTGLLRESRGGRRAPEPVQETPYQDDSHELEHQRFAITEHSTPPPVLVMHFVPYAARGRGVVSSLSRSRRRSTAIHTLVTSRLGRLTLRRRIEACTALPISRDASLSCTGSIEWRDATVLKKTRYFSGKNPVFFVILSSTVFAVVVYLHRFDTQIFLPDTPR